MPASRTPSAPRPGRTRLAVTGSAVALIAAAGGLAAWSPGAAPLAAAGRGTTLSVRSAPARPVTLDAFAPARTAPRAVTAGARRGRHLVPRQIAWRMLRSFRWSARQFQYLNRLWDRESGWNVRARNPSSGAAGIPQAMPGAKMASAGPDWRTSARTQIRWGLRYIRGRYGSPRRAWDHETSAGWY